VSKQSWEKGIARKLYTEEQIAIRTKELGARITEDFKDKDGDIIIACLLKGSVVFMADLCRSIELPIKMDFMSVSSYGDEMVSSREVKIVKDLDENIMGKHVIVVEDIIDSGLTLKKVMKLLGNRDPKSLSICTLLSKEARREADIKVEYIGFDIEDEFVVGYGLDFAQEYRNLPYVGVMGPLGEDK